MGDGLPAGVGGHMLNHARFATLDMGDTVVVSLGARINIHGFIDGGGEIGLGCLTGQIGT